MSKYAPNPYLLNELRRSVDESETAEQEYKSLKDFYDKTPEEREKILKEQEELKTENSKLSAKERKEKEIEEKSDESWLGYAKTFVFGYDEEPIVKGALEIGNSIKETITPNILKTADGCENKELILAERKSIAKKFAAKQLLKLSLIHI